MEFIEVPCTREIIEKPKSIFQDEKLLYLQPPKRRPSVYNRPYKKPTIKVDYNTTYGRSYMKFDRPSKFRLNYGMHEKMLASKTAKFDFGTTYNLSYQAINRIVSKAFVPKSSLSINGSHDMKSTNMLSYMDPGYPKVVRCKPYQGKVCYPVAMDCKTVTKESYQDFGLVHIKRPSKRDFWRTKFKTDYHTTNQLSYQYTGPVSKRKQMKHRPIISAQINKDTIYKTSYEAPGRFVNKENTVSV
nr:uncharacterized protein LOC117604414 [Osmia lignaria]